MSESNATADTEKAQARQTFDSMAAQYDSAIGLITRPIAAHLVTLAVDAGLKPSSSILDNACGTGIVLDELFKQTTPSLQSTLSITAVDASPAMTNVVRHRFETQGYHPAHFQALACPAEDLDALPSTTFTHSFTNFGFQFFRNPDKAASHVYRTLQPGGHAYITSWSDLSYITALNGACEEIRPGQPPIRLPFDDAWYQASHLEGILRKAGFGEVEMHNWDSGWTGDSIEGIVKGMWTFLKDAAKGQGWKDEDAERVPEAMVRAFEKYPKEILKQEENGVWRLKMVAHVAVCTK